MARLTVLEAIRAGLHEEMGRDSRVIILGEDVAKRGGVFLATAGLLDAFGEARVIDTPLAESAIVGVAVGAAMNGMLPVAEIQFADFIHPAMDQLINEAAKIRYRSNGGYGCPLVVRTPYGGGVRGGLYHSQSVEVFFCHVPGLKVVAPATPYDAKGLLLAAIRDPDPVVFLEHKKTYRTVRGEVPEGDYVVPIGAADVKRAGTHLTVITYGMALHLTLAAAAELAGEGIDAEVLDLRTLSPIDEAAVLGSVHKTGKVLVVHEDNRMVSLSSELSAVIAEKAFTDLDAPIMRLTGPDVPAMPYSPPLEAFCNLDTGKIAGAMRTLAAY